MSQRSPSWRITAVLVTGVLTTTVTAWPDDVLLGEEESRLKVSTSFPSGSVDVESIDHKRRVVRVRPAVHPGRGWHCWWYFKLTGIQPGETITVDLGGNKWAQPDRATFSTDQQNWQHSHPGEKRGARMVYRQPIEAAEAWFAWGPPFTDKDAAELVDWAAQQSPYAAARTLCHSREGRAVPALHVQQPGVEDAERYGIWVGARQHAWESGSSWVAQGLIEWLVSDEPRAEALRKNACIVIAPVMDVDNVALGAGGKNQKPHDHNRDWTDQPLFPEVAAAQNQIERFDQRGQMDLYVDLHNPAPENRDVYFYIVPQAMCSAARCDNTLRFLMASRTELTEPLAYRGRVVESGAGRGDPLWKQKSTMWIAQNTADHVVGVTLETPWNTPHSTSDEYRAVGRKLGLAINRYFRQPPK